MNINIFDKNGRISSKGGMVFHEQDITRLNYLFENDFELDFVLDYYNAGFGIVIEKPLVGSSKTGEDSFLLKLGKDNFSVYRKRYNGMERIAHMSCFFSPPKQKQRIKFIKTSNVVRVYHEDKQLGEFEIPRLMEKYYLSIYSNARNIVHQMDMKNNVPDAWVTNIKNTSGGRLSFTENQVQFESCQQDAEIEQHHIALEKGRYYVGYETTGKAEVIVFHAKDVSFDDAKKNIIQEGSYFDVKEDGLFNIKIKAMDAIVKNIHIRKEENGTFIPTGDAIKDTPGSYFNIIIDLVKKLRWKGTIFYVPTTYKKDNRPFFMRTSAKTYRMEETVVNVGEEYAYEFDRETMLITIKQGEEVKQEIPILANADERMISLFRNMNAAIREMIVTNNDDEETNLILQKIIKTFVPATQADPILITAENGEAFDLSSSYRQYEEGGKTHYLFTNWEREFFDDKDQEFILEKMARGWSGDMKIYGILSKEVSWPNILTIKKNLDNVDFFSSHYDLIQETRYDYDTETRNVSLNVDVLEKYDLFVIDYLKDNSYCINQNKELGAYEVDIATSKKKVIMHYEQYDNNGESLSSMIDTGIVADKNQYIILRETFE